MKCSQLVHTVENSCAGKYFREYRDTFFFKGFFDEQNFFFVVVVKSY